MPRRCHRGRPANNRRDQIPPAKIATAEVPRANAQPHRRAHRRACADATVSSSSLSSRVKRAGVEAEGRKPPQDREVSSRSAGPSQAGWRERVLTRPDQTLVQFPLGSGGTTRWSRSPPISTHPPPVRQGWLGKAERTSSSARRGPPQRSPESDRPRSGFRPPSILLVASRAIGKNDPSGPADTLGGKVENAATLGCFASELTVQPCEQAMGFVDGLACMAQCQRDADGDGSAVIGLPSPKKLMLSCSHKKARQMLQGQPVLPKS